MNSIVKLVMSSFSCAVLLANVNAMNRADMSFTLPEVNYCQIQYNQECTYKHEYLTIKAENQTFDHAYNDSKVNDVKHQKRNKNVCQFIQLPSSNGHISTHKHVAEAPKGKDFRPEFRRLDKTMPSKAEARRNARHARKLEAKKAMND